MLIDNNTSIPRHSQGRIIEFDILKGFLIICVVLGHCGITLKGFDVYWFHMPCFFIISGYFMKHKPDEPLMSKLRKAVTRYAIPYFSFSILLFIIFQPESLMKFVARILYGGLMNITVFSYPFWFINTLFISIITLGIVGKMKAKLGGGIILIAYFIDLLYLFKINFPLPWGLECVFISLPYLVIGSLFSKSYKFQRWHYIIAIIPITIIVCSILKIYEYKLDIAAHKLFLPVFDILIPSSFFWCLWRLSILINKLPIFRALLSGLGKSCMVIFFTHASIIHVTKELNSGFIFQTILALFIGYLLYKLLNTTVFFRCAFLGKRRLQSFHTC